jgi:hypothetical protein
VELRARLIETDALAALGNEKGALAALARVLALSSKIGDEELRKTFFQKGPWNARILRLAAERL